MLFCFKENSHNYRKKQLTKNKYWKEIKSLWENERKNKKIESEYQSIVHLYSKFLLEILWNKQKQLLKIG